MELWLTWGSADYGGDCSAVQDKLRDVRQIQASVRAFAAILGDGSVVTWGDADYGGDSSAVHEQLRECAADPSFSWCICCNPGSMDLWSPGVIRTRVATAARYGISCPMCSRPIPKRENQLMIPLSWGAGFG